LPRRLSAPSPASWQIALALLVPPIHALLVWQQMIGAAHALWAIEGWMLTAFAGTRIYGSKAQRRGPVGFAWVPIAFSFGLVGSVLLSIREFSPKLLPAEIPSFAWLLLIQGMFMCLVFGIGALFLPLVTRKESSVDADQLPDASKRGRAHGLAAIGILLGFALEAQGWLSSGRALRAVLALAVLIASAEIHRPPSVPGTQRKLIWIASWCIPIGLGLAAAFPTFSQIGLHVFFLGGIGLITMCVALHVALSHSTGQDLVMKPVWQTQVFGGSIFLALACRIVAELDPAHRFDWIAAGAALFMFALLPWGQMVLPRLLPTLFQREE